MMHPMIVVSDLLVIFTSFVPLAQSCPGPSMLSRAATKCKRVDFKPPDADSIVVVSDQSHLRYCMKKCLFTEDCQTIVFDADLAQCDLYNSTSTTGGALSTSQMAVKMDEIKYSYGPDPYKKDLFANPTGITCQHSSNYIASQKCQNFLTRIGAWTAAPGDTYASLTFEFATSTTFAMVIMKTSTGSTYRCRVLRLTLNGVETLTMTDQCDNQYRCVTSEGGLQGVEMTVLKVQCIEGCPGMTMMSVEHFSVYGM